MGVLLAVDELKVSYGSGVQAVHDASLQVEEGELVALLGPNGAGKTSLLRAISGMLSFHKGRVTQGSVLYAGTDLGPRMAHERTRMGIAQTFEGRRILRDFSVEDNLLAGGVQLAPNALRSRLAEIYARFPLLQERRAQQAGLLSGGQQQLLALGRAMIAAPRLLLIDEPSLGLAPVMISQVAETIRSIRAFGTTILLVEQNAHLALELADRAVVMQDGRTVRTGIAAELRSDGGLRQFYLGIGAAHVPLRRRPQVAAA